MQKIVLVQGWHFQHPLRSMQGVERLHRFRPKQRVQVGTARQWAVKVGMDERYPILWQLKVILDSDNSLYEKIAFALFRQGFLCLKNNSFPLPIYDRKNTVTFGSEYTKV